MLQNIETFFLWFLNRLPSFLLSEPIIYFVALLILTWVFKLISYLTSYHE